MSKGPLIKTKGKIQLIHYPDKSWHIEYKRKWLPTLYWMCGFEYWSTGKPNYQGDMIDENYQNEAFKKAVASLNKTEASRVVVKEKDV